MYTMAQSIKIYEYFVILTKSSLLVITILFLSFLYHFCTPGLLRVQERGPGFLKISILYIGISILVSYIMNTAFIIRICIGTLMCCISYIYSFHLYLCLVYDVRCFIFYINYYFIIPYAYMFSIMLYIQICLILVYILISSQLFVLIHTSLHYYIAHTFGFSRI